MAAPLPIAFLLPFIDAARTTFQTMLATEVRRTAVRQTTDPVSFDGESGMVGFTGSKRGTCTLYLPVETAVAMGVGPRAACGAVDGTTARAGAGTLVSALAEDARMRLAGTPYRFDVTLAVDISGGSYAVFHRPGVDGMAIQFETAGGLPFVVVVRVAHS